MPKTAIVVLACDLEEKGRRLGQESHWRCVAGANAYREERSAGREAVIIVSASMAPGREYPRQSQSMAEMMRSHLRALGVPPASVIVGREGWGSFAELRSAAEVISEETVISRVIIVSGWYHIPRLRLIWRRAVRSLGLAPRLPRQAGPWKVSFKRSRAKFAYAWWELVKLPRELWENIRQAKSGG